MILDLIGNAIGAMKPTGSVDVSENENYLFQNMTVAQMDDYTVKVKMEALRMVLESCIKKGNDGGPVIKKESLTFIIDFVHSLGYELASNIKFGENLLMQDSPKFTLYTKTQSDVLKTEMDAKGLEFMRHNLMDYQFQEVRSGRGETRWIFYMKNINTRIMDKKKEKA